MASKKKNSPRTRTSSAHKSSGGKNVKKSEGKVNVTWIIIAVVVALLVAAVVAFGIGSDWFTITDMSKWFNYWGKGPIKAPTGVEITPDSIIVFSSAFGVPARA